MKLVGMKLTCFLKKMYFDSMKLIPIMCRFKFRDMKLTWLRETVKKK